MANETKAGFLEELSKRYGPLRRLERSQSLYDIGNGAARVYVRYSRVHAGKRTFYGLRKVDLQRLEGHPSLMCFLWQGQLEPLLVPFSEYEETFQSISPAGDGQYKVQIYIQDDGNELYIANAGRFNVEAHMGWQELASLIDRSELRDVPKLSHSQIQTLLGSIGAMKGYDIWVPPSDRKKLDWAITDRFDYQRTLPQGLETVECIVSEIDVIWIERGASKLRAFFEVEHSTPIYSGLLRLNDIHLVSPQPGARYKGCLQ